MAERQSLKDRIEHDFRYHAPTVDKVPQHARIRDVCLDLARQIVELTPESREQSLAITALEEVMFWAIAAIARGREQ